MRCAPSWPFRRECISTASQLRPKYNARDSGGASRTFTVRLAPPVSTQFGCLSHPAWRNQSALNDLAVHSAFAFGLCMHALLAPLACTVCSHSLSLWLCLHANHSDE